MFDYNIPNPKKIDGKMYKLYNTHLSKESAALTKYHIDATYEKNKWYKPSIRIVQIKSTKKGEKPIWCVYIRQKDGRK